MGLSCGLLVPFWYLACLCFIIQTVNNVAAQAQQQKRSSRITSSRSFGTNIKTSGSNGIDFDCPEEFGYYPHPSDCTQYYVCVFGGALLESCTGGLMYSHELQTCDWPRNVGCELVDSGSSSLSSGGSSNAGIRTDKQQQQQQQSINGQHVPSRVRFGSAFSSPAATTQPPKATVPPQYHRQPPQVIQAQVQSLPQHSLPQHAPGTVIGSRGQPKPFVATQDDIAQLYADAHDTLPPVEEEESDRQQRVYRGQPSTVSQVQRDRDGIIHQASINAIPNHGKIGSYTYGSQYSQNSVEFNMNRNDLETDEIVNRIDIDDIEREAFGISRRVMFNSTALHKRVKRDLNSEVSNKTEIVYNIGETLKTDDNPKTMRELRQLDFNTGEIVNTEGYQKTFEKPKTIEYRDKNDGTLSTKMTNEWKPIENVAYPGKSEMTVSAMPAYSIESTEDLKPIELGEDLAHSPLEVGDSKDDMHKSVMEIVETIFEKLAESPEIMENLTMQKSQDSSGNTTTIKDEHQAYTYPSEDAQKQNSTGAAVLETLNNLAALFDVDYDTEQNDSAVAEGGMRSARQLRPYFHARSRFQIQNVPGTYYRAIDSAGSYQPQQQLQPQTSYGFGPFNPYLTPPTTVVDYHQLSPGYQVFAQSQVQQQSLQQPQRAQNYAGPRPKYVYTGALNPPPPPPPPSVSPVMEADFRAVEVNYYHTTSTPKPSTRPRRPNLFNNPDLIPYILQALREYQEQRKKLQQQQQQQNYQYYYLESENDGTDEDGDDTESKDRPPHTQPTKAPGRVTANSHFSQSSTVGGFYNNKEHGKQRHPQEGLVNYKTTAKHPPKLVSQYNIPANYMPTTTESSYFKYNILTNQKMKAFHSTNKPALQDGGLYASGVPRYTTSAPLTSNIVVVNGPSFKPHHPSISNSAFATTTATTKPTKHNTYLKYPESLPYRNSSAPLPESYSHVFTTISSTSTSTISPKLKVGRPVSSSNAIQPSRKPAFTMQFNVPEFVASLQSSDLANMNPQVVNMIKYFKQLNTPTAHRTKPTTSAPTRKPVVQQYKYQIETTTEANRQRLTTTPPRRPQKGYDDFIKSIPNQSDKPLVVTSGRPTQHSYEYDGEYEEEDESLGTDTDDEIMPPSRMPPYMPMSETMAPPRPNIILPVATTAIPIRATMPTRTTFHPWTTQPPPPPRATTLAFRPQHDLTKPPTFHTGVIEATTARGPFSNIDFKQFYHTTTKTDNKPTKQQSQIPSFINFPSDIFQEFKQRLPPRPQLGSAPSAPTLTDSNSVHLTTKKTSTTTTTTTTTTPRVITLTTSSNTLAPTRARPITTPTPTITKTTTTTTYRTRTTVRAEHRNRGQSKWQSSKSSSQNHKESNIIETGNNNKTDFGFRKRPAATPASSALGPVQLNVNMHLDAADNGQRPDASSPSSAPPASHYIQQQQPQQAQPQQQPRLPTAVLVEAIPHQTSNIQNSNQLRNYYNTSALLNHAGYESQANILNQQQHQQQQQHQLQQQQQQVEQQHQIVLQHQQQQQEQQQQQHQQQLRQQQQQLQQQQQQQQQPLQSQQAPLQNNNNQEPSSYEQYYSVYDDDLDLYRDIEYQQPQPPSQLPAREQPQQQPQHQSKYQAIPVPVAVPQQPVRPVQPVQQSTYRPLEILTTPAPIREAYKPQEKPTYNKNNNQQSLIYNTDYDEDLIAQIEQDNNYDQPTRTPTRSRVNIETLPPPTTTPRPLRHPTISDTHSLYESSYENADVFGGDGHDDDDDDDANIDDLPSLGLDDDRDLYEKPRSFTTYEPQLISTQESDEYNIIGSTRFEQDSNRVYDPTSKTTRVVTATTRSGGNTNAVQRRYPSTTPATTRVTTTTTTTTTTPAPKPRTTTGATATQIWRTTAQPTTTTKSLRSKTLANKYEKNQPRSQPNQPKKSAVKYTPPSPSPIPTLTHTKTTQSPAAPTRSPNTTTTTQKPSQSYPISQYLESEETFVTVVSKQKQANRTPTDSPNTPNLPNTPTSRNSPQVQPSIFSYRVQSNSETISDASQSVQVQTPEPYRSTERSLESTTSTLNDKRKFFATLGDLADFGESAHGNSVRAISEKTISTGKYVTNDNFYRANKHSEENIGKSSEEKGQPGSRLQNYVISDVAPQSFKPPATSGGVPLPSSFISEPLANSAPALELISDEGSTTLRYLTNIAYEPKPFKYNLQTNSNGFSLLAQSAEETEVPIYERKPYAAVAEQQTSTFRTVAPPSTSNANAYAPSQKVPFKPDSHEEEIVPTTYAPSLRNVWHLGRTSIKPPQHISLESSNEASDYSSSSETTASSMRSTTSLATTSTTKASLSTAPPRATTTPRTTTTTTTKPATPSTERSLQSNTPRALTFKDFVKPTSNPAQRFVSPYKSLETILQEKDDRYPSNALRSTAKPRYTNPTTPTTFIKTTTKPVRSYFLITAPQRNLSDAIFSTASTGSRNFSVSDVILSTFSNTPRRVTASSQKSTTTTSPKPTTTTTAPITETATESTTPTTISTVIATSPIRISQSAGNVGDSGAVNSDTPRPRGRSRFTAATVNTSDEPTTYAPRVRYPSVIGAASGAESTTDGYPKRRKVQRARIVALQGQRNAFPLKTLDKYENYRAEKRQRQQTAASKYQKSVNRKPIENQSTSSGDGPRAEALVSLSIDTKQDNSIEPAVGVDDSSSTEYGLDDITDRPVKYLFSNKYRQQTKDRTLAESLQNAGYITSSTGRSKLDTASVLEQLQLFLSGDSDESSAQQFVDDLSEREISAAVKEIKNLYTTPKATTTTPTTTTTYRPPTTTTTTTLRPTTTAIPPTNAYRTASATHSTPVSTPPTPNRSSAPQNTYTQSRQTSFPSSPSTSSFPPPPSAYPSTSSTPTSKSLLTPTRASRVNNAIKSSIAAAAYSAASSPTASTSATANASPQASSSVGSANTARGNSLKASAYFTNAGAAVKCSDTTLNAKCNEIPPRTNSNNNRNRGSSTYAGQDRDTAPAVTSNRGTHPPRTRPTLKPSGTIVSKAQEFVDIYRYPPSRPEPLYPQPTPDKTAAKCRKDVCLLPDCSCGGKDIPGDLPVESVPQIVLITFDDSVNDLNKQLYIDLFEKGRVNPNGCPITATFYVSHEWTDYSQVQNLYSDGHEMASHTVSHSFGEQFSQKKWTREIAGQREILAAYGGVKLSDVRGMRAPFLSVGGNKMYKMLYDSNFTYDSSLPVYENRPPSWPYTFDYKIFHDCMIPPCPTRSYPGVWQVPMVMWQDLNGGRCSMGDACSNPSEADGVFKMIMKNFERHYTTNRAPFGLYYHAAWFTQPHHKEGFIKFLDTINQMNDVWIVTNWQMLQWVRDPTPLSRINSFQPFQCDYSDRPKRCNNPKVCNLWHKSGVRYMKTCQPCPDIYPWTGKSGIRSSRIDNEIEDSAA